MDRFAENTLRTLAIVLISMFVILGCGVLLLLGLCFGAIVTNGNSSDKSAGTALILGTIVAGIALISVGVFIISTLAKGMVSSTSAATAHPYSLTPPPVTKPLQPAPPPLSDEAKLDQALTSLEVRTKRTEPPSPEPQNPEPLKASTLPAAHEPRPVDVRHLSPTSRTAIQQLAYAIIAKVAAEVALGIVGWLGALGVPRFVRVPFPVYRFGFMAWGLAAIAPHLVLLYALARRPGPRAFAYSLVIPSVHLLFGFFGHSAFLAFVLRAGQTAAPLLSIAPWFLDILILYLAWKAIRQTGIEPNPSRLIIASVVIFAYSAMLPGLALFLSQWR